MNKIELVDAIAAAANIKKSEAETVLDAVLDSITAELKKGNEVRLVGFGTFVVSHRAAIRRAQPAHRRGHQNPGQEAAALPRRQGIEGRDRLTPPAGFSRAFPLRTLTDFGLDCTRAGD